MNNVYQSELYHHGILGMRWGKKNGPPYPLGASDHSASEKKAGWRKSLDKSSKSKQTKNKSTKKSDHTSDEKNHSLTDKQKKAIKIGAAAVATSLMAYGTYRLAKSGKLDKYIEKGKTKVNEFLSREKNKTASSQSFQKHQNSNLFDGSTLDDEIFNFGKQAAWQTQKTNQFAGGIKKLARPETVNERIKNTNPLWFRNGDKSGKHNCVFCGIAAFLRGQGYDVTAKGSIKSNDTIQVVEKCFKGAKILDGIAVKFGRSRADAAEMLVNKFGQNAEGLCSIQWRNSDPNAPRVGHCFNWIIKNGIVEFFDAQTNRDDNVVSKHYWARNLIDPQGSMALIRLDGCEINKDVIFEYVENNRY